MASIIRNQSAGPLTLPEPMFGVIGSGEGIVVNLPAGEVIVNFGGKLPNGILVAEAPTPTGLALIAANVAAGVPNAVHEYWVDGVNGSDSNPGTARSPFATPDRAMQVIGDTIVQNVVLHIAPLLDGETYKLDTFQRERFISRWFKIIGYGREEIVAPVPIDSQVGTLLTFTTAAPGWTTDDFVGLHAEMINPDGTIMGYGTIGFNDADTIQILSAKQTNLAPGGSVRIVRPAVQFENTAPEGDFPLAVGGGMDGIHQLNVPGGGIAWVNIGLKTRPDEFARYVFTGAHLFVGVCVSASRSTFGNIVHLNSTNVWSGAWDNSYSPEIGIEANEQVGWGLSMYNSANPIQPGELIVTGASMVQGSFVAGWLGAFDGSYVQVRSGIRLTGGGPSGSYGESRGLNGWFGASCVTGDGGAVEVDDNQSPGNGPTYRHAGSTGISTWMAGACGTILLKGDGPIYDGGTGDHLLTRWGQAQMENYVGTPINGSPMNIAAYYGGSIRLSSGGGAGTDYSWVGTATIGIPTGKSLTRPSGAWVAGESVDDQAVDFSDLPSDGGSAIFRTS